MFCMIPDCYVLCTLAIFKNIRNPLIFLQKMATYSCFWRVKRSKILLQASLHRISDLLTLVSLYYCIILFAVNQANGVYFTSSRNYNLFVTVKKKYKEIYPMQSSMPKILLIGSTCVDVIIEIDHLPKQQRIFSQSARHSHLAVVPITQLILYVSQVSRICL